MYEFLGLPSDVFIQPAFVSIF